MHVHRADDGIIRSLGNPDSIRPAAHFAGRITARNLLLAGGPGIIRVGPRISTSWVANVKMRVLPLSSGMRKH